MLTDAFRTSHIMICEDIRYRQHVLEMFYNCTQFLKGYLGAEHLDLGFGVLKSRPVLGHFSHINAKWNVV